MNDIRPKRGIIQSRGLGDILMAIPIAKHNFDQGYDIVWPICEEFYPAVRDHVPWVLWKPIKTDQQGLFFYNTPLEIIKTERCDDFVCLYQSLTGHPELSGRNYFQIQKFDEHKYTAASVPFIKKWTIAECVHRNPDFEQDLYNRVVKQPLYYVTHFKGSDYTAHPDLSDIPEDWQRIDIDDHLTTSPFDWLKVLEGAQALIAIDSVIANMVDQFKLDSLDKYWIPRSHIHLTPVLGSAWTILEPPEDSKAYKPIFQSSN